MRLRFWKKKRPELDRRQAFDARPVQNPDLRWERDEEGRISLWVPRRESFWLKILGKLFYLPPGRPVELDTLGTFVYDQCDGTHSIRDILQMLVARHDLGRREAEVALTTYLRTLMQRGIVGMMVPEESDGGGAGRKKRSVKRRKKKRRE
jgi:hypothetical protein